MAILTTTQARPEQVDWLHWLYLRGNRAMSISVDVRGNRSYVLTLLPLWSPEDQTTETFSRLADAQRHHAELTRQLHKAGWLLVEGRPVTTAA